MILTEAIIDKVIASHFPKVLLNTEEDEEIQFEEEFADEYAPFNEEEDLLRAMQESLRTAVADRAAIISETSDRESSITGEPCDQRQQASSKAKERCDPNVTIWNILCSFLLFFHLDNMYTTSKII